MRTYPKLFRIFEHKLNKTMKKILIALCTLFVAVGTVQAQDDDAEKQALAVELASIDLKMEVDTSIFQKASTNMYVSQAPQVMVMGMVVPENYDNAKAKLESNLPPEFNISDKGEKMLNGVKVIFLEGTSKSPQGVINCVVYCMKRDADTCTMFMGMSEKGVDKKYTDAIDEAANSIIKPQ